MKIIDLDCVTSTNDYCKACAADGDLAVFAARQSGGRGTKGRSFLSEEGGIYLSLLRRYENFPASRAFEIMINSSVAVCRTLEDFGLTPRIKWANDVLVGDKKICGTLIENTLSGAKITRSIVGMGLNVNNPIDPEIESIATSMSLERGAKLDIEEVKARLLLHLGERCSVGEYKSYIDWLGREVALIIGEKTVRATALDVAENGALIVLSGGKKIELTAGEVSLRL